MHRKLSFSLLLLAATSLTSQAALVWTVGVDDNGWPLTGTTGGAAANFVQEDGAINPMPGSPNSTAVPRGADNDYYFGGVYSTAIPSNVTNYGAYTPIGISFQDENSAERAFAGGDLDLRYHFNLPTSLRSFDTLSVTFDALNLDDRAENPDPRFGVEIYFNSILVMPQVIIRAAQFDQNFTSPQFSLASVGAVTGSGADNIVSLRGISYNGTGAGQGGGNWMGVDFVQLDSQVVPEPSSAMILLFGAMSITPFLRRRRS